MKYAKKKVQKFVKKQKETVADLETIISIHRQYILADKPTVLRRKWEDRICDLIALHKTEFIWCVGRKQMLAVEVCYCKCRKKKYCRKYQNYINGCDRDGNPLL